MALKVPKGATGAFRIGTEDAHGCRFAIHAYGNGRGGWFVATHRFFGPDQDSGLQLLPDGEWPTLLHLIELCDFWNLPEDGSHLDDPTVAVDDGIGLSVSGRDAARYHRVHRFNWWEPGLQAVLTFGHRVSGFFERHPL